MQKYLVVSFHDLAPHSKRVCEDVLLDLKAIGIERTTLLVTPKWHHGGTVDQFPEFLSWLRARRQEGHEICLHGYTHRADFVSGGLISQSVGRIYTAREGEFYQISYQAAVERIRHGLGMLCGAGLDVQGFVPPAWLLSHEGHQALVDEGLIYSTELQHIDCLQLQRRIFAPVLVFSCRSEWRRWMSRRWVKLWERINRQTLILRLAIHPVDWEYPLVRETILELARQIKTTRESLTYLEFVQRIA